MSSKEKQNLIVEILERMRQVMNARYQYEIAEALGVEKGTISTWKERGTIPYEHLFSFADKHKVSINWLLSGEKEREIRGISEELLEKYPFLKELFRAAESEDDLLMKNMLRYAFEYMDNLEKKPEKKPLEKFPVNNKRKIRIN